jgi:hypothetical protein
MRMPFTTPRCRLPALPRRLRLALRRQRHEQPRGPPRHDRLVRRFARALTARLPVSFSHAAPDAHRRCHSTFTISLNPLSEYEGGGTLLPDLRDAEADASAPYETIVVKPDVGCVASFPGRLRHGGNAITSGFRYIIPLFIYLDVNKATGKPRGWLLESAGMQPGHMTGLDAVEV